MASTMDEAWIITTVAGTGIAGFAGDGGPAERARLNGPFDLGFDRAGNLCFSDTFNHRIRRIDAQTGIIATWAGSGEPGYSGDGGPAIRARLNEPYGIALDQDGNLYIADRHNHCVRRVDPAGVITTFAGDGTAGFGGDGGPAAAAQMVEPNGLALDPAGTRLFIADVGGHRVRVVDLASGTIATFAGTGAAEHGGDDGPAAEARIHGARAVEVAADGTVYILERQGSTLRRVDPHSGVITTIAGTGGRGYSGDGGPAVAALFDAPKELALDRDGNPLVVDTENHAIRRIDLSSGIVVTIAGGRRGSGGDGGPASAAGLDRPHGAAVGADGAIYIGDTNNHRIRKLTPRR
jgi:DNA-binding beta-propeller fold protein YncE